MLQMALLLIQIQGGLAFDIVRAARQTQLALLQIFRLAIVEEVVQALLQISQLLHNS